MIIYYAHPYGFTCSFSLVAKKHVEYLTKYKYATVIATGGLVTSSRTYDAVVLHPYVAFHPMVKGRVKGKAWIGIEVCDSDKISNSAVEVLNTADKVILPSNYCVNVYRNSGVKSKLTMIPHGVEDYYYTLPNQWWSKNTLTLKWLYDYKAKSGKRILLFWYWYRAERKGWSEVRELWSRLKRERKDVALVVKTIANSPISPVEAKNLDVVLVREWLSEHAKLLLYDLADITLLFSWSGGFELNCLESLTRLTPCIAHNKGPWVDYLPEYLRVKAGEKVVAIPGNKIHVGYGYRVDVEDALSKIHDILENHDDYKAKLKEYRDKVLREEYTWSKIAWRLYREIREEVELKKQIVS